MSGRRDDIGVEKVNVNNQTFNSSWRNRKESYHNYWTNRRPKNQVQLAYRNHWKVLLKLLGSFIEDKDRIVEVGCGRGTISSYFAAYGCRVTLLDYSLPVLRIARGIYRENDHKAELVQGDANFIPFSANSFDIVISMGLLEHFQDAKKTIEEQIRILKPGGYFLAYVVPERKDNIQRYFRWLNWILNIMSKASRLKRREKPKEALYRTHFRSEHYIEAVKGLDIENLLVLGMYPLPMISHSPEFPFSPLPMPFEWLLTRVFEGFLVIRGYVLRKCGWICAEKIGQAFLLVLNKRSD
ncbi:MAG: class I SAM-dependent methyltransferase [Thermodesulfobacteriota bacterium]